MTMLFLVVWIFTQISFTLTVSNTYNCLSSSPCGCSLKSAVLSKIIGGEAAKRDTWGWAVSIRSGNSHFCGGSLISPELVITAAHCFVSVPAISKITVTAGSENLNNVKQKRSISEVFIHRNYDSDTFVNDIAIIHLSSPFDMNDQSLALICLPTKTTQYNSTNTDVVAIGWGVVSMVNKITSNTLQQVTLKTIANNDATCRRSIRDVKVQFCAGVSGGGKDTCQGDSGGPLMMFSNQQWYLIGITSYGMECALATHAGVYTRVSVYQDSIMCIWKNDISCAKNVFAVRNSVSSISIFFYMYSFSIFLILYFI